MAKSATAIRIMQMRKQILTNLNRVPVLRSESLYRTVVGFDPDYNKGYFRKDVDYLHEKGYIRFVDDAIGGCDCFEDRYLKLTAAGNEIANGINIDPALEI